MLHLGVMFERTPVDSWQSLEWRLFCPVLLMPIAFATVCGVLNIAWGLHFACFPVLLLLIGLGTLYFCGRVLRYSPIAPIAKAIMFLAILFAVYLQIQLPILIGMVHI